MKQYIKQDKTPLRQERKKKILMQFIHIYSV